MIYPGIVLNVFLCNIVKLRLRSFSGSLPQGLSLLALSGSYSVTVTVT